MMLSVRACILMLFSGIKNIYHLFHLKKTLTWFPVLWVTSWSSTLFQDDNLVGLVVKASAWRAADPHFDSWFCPDFSRSSHTNDLKIGIPVATLPGTQHYRVRAGTGWCSQYTITGWYRKLDLHLLSQCGSMYTCLSGSVPEIH